MNPFQRFTHYKQHDASDCGPTSLRMIAKHYGIDYSAEMLRCHCHSSRRGVNMLGISEAAEHIGFETAGVKMTFGQLAEEGVFPCILHWNQNHFVVCYGTDWCRDGGYRIHISAPRIAAPDRTSGDGTAKTSGLAGEDRPGSDTDPLGQWL